MKMTVFWDVAPCYLADIDRCFRGTFCLHHQGSEIYLHNIQNELKIMHVSKCEPNAFISRLSNRLHFWDMAKNENW
jgi:hypothetical protein